MLERDDIIHIFESHESVTHLSEQYQVEPNLIIDIRLRKKHRSITKELIPGFIKLGKLGKPKLEQVVAEYIIASTDSYKYLADHLGVVIHTIYDVRSGRTWKHLDRSKKANAKSKRHLYINRPHAKLDAQQLPTLLNKLITQRNAKVAKEYGISISSISSIRRNRSWQDIPRPKELRVCCTKKGIHHYNCKLTPKEINYILKSKIPVKDLSKKYDVAPSTIYRIKQSFRSENETAKKV